MNTLKCFSSSPRFLWPFKELRAQEHSFFVTYRNHSCNSLSILTCFSPLVLPLVLEEKEIDESSKLLHFGNYNQSLVHGDVRYEAESKPKVSVDELYECANTLSKVDAIEDLSLRYDGIVSAELCEDLLHFLHHNKAKTADISVFLRIVLRHPSLLTERALLSMLNLLDSVATEGKGDLDTPLFNNLMSYLVQCKRYEEARFVFEAMEVNNILPDHITCSIMISNMRKTRKTAKEQWEFFEKMTDKGVKWSQEILCSLVKSFCEEGLKEAAIVILYEIKKKGIAPNCIAYNTLIEAYCKCDQIAEAEGLISEMKGENIDLTTDTFNILIEAYGSRTHHKAIENLLLEMKEAGAKPNSRTYSALMKTYASSKTTSHLGVKAFQKMVEDGIAPTSDSFASLIQACAHMDSPDDAYVAYRIMIREGMSPSEDTCKHLISSFRKRGDPERLMRIWGAMGEASVDTHNMVLEVLAKRCLLLEVRRVIKEMKKMGLNPNVVTYNILIKACACVGEHAKMAQVLREMRAVGVDPDSDTYAALIRGCVRARDFERAIVYHKLMKKEGVVLRVKCREELRVDLDEATKNEKGKDGKMRLVYSKLGFLRGQRGQKDEFWKKGRAIKKT